jgi:hypothetical protein
VTFHNVTFGQKALLGRILHNFRLRMRTPNDTPKAVTSARHGTCTTTLVKSKTREKAIVRESNQTGKETGTTRYTEQRS